MTVVVSFTLSDADAQRVTSAGAGLGFATGKGWVAQLIKDAVRQYESGQAVAAAQTNYQSTTQPVNPA